MFNLTFAINFLILIMALVAIWLIFSLIWRIQSDLRVDYKYLQVAVIILGANSFLKILENLYVVSVGIVFSRFLDFLFLVFFIIAFWKKRNALRRITGEIK